MQLASEGLISCINEPMVKNETRKDKLKVLNLVTSPTLPRERSQGVVRGPRAMVSLKCAGTLAKPY